MNNTPQDRSADGVPEVEQKIRIGDTVQRLGEEGPDRPAGTVTSVSSFYALVAFAGLVPTMVRLDALVKVGQARPLNLDRAIAECKRFEEIDRAAVARGESANWWERDTAPEIEQCDECESTGQNCWAHRAAPEIEQEKTAAELLSIIRESLHRYVPGGGEQYLDRYLDRIAGAVPQRATDAEGWGIHLHTCGAAQSAKRGDGVCRTCGAKSGDDGWRALYTLGEVR